MSDKYQTSVKRLNTGQGTNRYKWLGFHDRISRINIDIFHRIDRGEAVTYDTEHISNQKILSTTTHFSTRV